MLKKLLFLLRSYESNWKEYERLKKQEQDYFNVLAVKKDSTLLEKGKWQKCQFYLKLDEDGEGIQIDEIRIDTMKQKGRPKNSIDPNTKLLLHQSPSVDLDSDEIFEIGRDPKFGESSMNFKGNDGFSVG